MLADIGQYLWDLADHWAAFLTGGIPVAVLVVWERWRSKQWSFRLFVAVFLVFGFVAANFQTWRQEYNARTKAEQAADYRGLLANRWEPLSTEEALTFKRDLRKIKKIGIRILCNFSGCSDLAFSIEGAFIDEGWEVTVDPGMGPTENGVQFWAKDRDLRQIPEAIELSTKGRIKAHFRAEDLDHPLDDKYAVLVVGRKR